MEPAHLALLGFTAANRAVTLYLEGINPGAAVADQRIVAEIDPDGAGPLGFLAADAVRTTVARVDLRDTADNNREIIGGYVAWIAADPEPRMPQLRVRVIPDLGAASQAQWTTRTRYQDHGRNDDIRVPPAPQGQGPPPPVTLALNQPWDIAAAFAGLPEEQRIFGGRATLGLNVGALFQQDLQFRIRGRNPEDAVARAYIDQRAGLTNPEDLWFAYAIAKSESLRHAANGDPLYYNQFYPVPARGTTDKGLPLWGRPDGWGMFQIDYSRQRPRVATIAEIWNWRVNVRSGLEKLAEKRVEATTWMQSLAPRGARPTGQRPQSQVDAGGGVYQPDPNGDGNTADAAVVGGAPIAVPNEIVNIHCAFIDGNERNIEDAVTMKGYNGSSRPPGGFAGYYVAWSGPQPRAGFAANQWIFTRTNAENPPFNYVARVCAEVEQ